MTTEMSMIPVRQVEPVHSDSFTESAECSLNEFIEELQDEINNAGSKSNSKSGTSTAKSRSRYLEEEKNRTKGSLTRSSRVGPGSRKPLLNQEQPAIPEQSPNSDSDSRYSNDAPSKGRSSMGLNFCTENLNVLVVGESKTGKTELIKKFIAFKTRKPVVSKDLGNGFVEYVVDLLADSSRRILTLTHMTGYSNKQPIKTWYTNLKSFIVMRIDAHQQKLKLMASNKDAIIDERIHLCFFLFRSPKPRFNDIICMKKMNKMTLVVPVEIGKREDAKSPVEAIRTMKRNVLNELEDCEVETFNFHQKDGFLRSLVGGFLGDCPLLFLVEPKEQEDLEIDDFLVFSSLVSRLPQILYLKDIEQRFTNRTERLNKKSDSNKVDSSSDLKRGIGLGMAVGVGLLSAVVAFKHKLV